MCLLVVNDNTSLFFAKSKSRKLAAMPVRSGKTSAQWLEMGGVEEVDAPPPYFQRKRGSYGK